jgi:transposase
MSSVIHWDNKTAIYLHVDPVDFRKSINGLSLIVEDEMALSSISGSLFVFCNKKRDKLKALYWDESGFALWYKRLEKEKFKWPKNKAQSTLSIDQEQWNWLLRGFNINQMQAHKKIHFSALS